MSSVSPSGPGGSPVAGERVPLSELIEYAWLSPRQAAVVVLDVWHALVARAGEDRLVGPVDAEAVRIDSARRTVTVAGAEGAGDAAATLEHAPSPVVSAVREDLVPPAAGRRDRDAAVRVVLEDLDDRLADGTDGDEIRACIDRLARVAAPVEWSARLGLAALVAGCPAGTIRQAPEATVPRSAGGGERPSVRRLLKRPLAVLLAFVVLVAAEAVLLRGELARSVQVVTGGAAADVRVGEVDPPAPAATSSVPAGEGAVRSVTLRAVRSCGAGDVCPVAVSIAVHRLREPLTVRWSLVVTDRCAGVRVARSGGTMHARPGATQLAEVEQARLPDGRALAATAVTRSPVRVSSPVVPVTAGGRCAR